MWTILFNKVRMTNLHEQIHNKILIKVCHILESSSLLDISHNAVSLRIGWRVKLEFWVEFPDWGERFQHELTAALTQCFPIFLFTSLTNVGLIVIVIVRKGEYLDSLNSWLLNNQHNVLRHNFAQN